MTDNRFIYSNYTTSKDRRTISFGYEIYQNSEHFKLTESVTFPQPLQESKAINAGLKALHLALGVSYYKIFVSESINHPYAMSKTEATFWNTVFTKGLGEFLYINQLSKTALAQFEAQAGIDTPQDKSWTPDSKALLGIGGGKDSIVAGELLKLTDTPLDGFVLATGDQLGQTKEVTDAMEVDLLPAERVIDKQLLVLQERDDAYKGHVPISLVFGLIGTIIAISEKYKYIVVANESSASIPRVQWQGDQINHQWSKSFEFETMLQKYIHELISPNLTYFSAIRPLGSVAIAKLFAKLSQYHNIFTSDNSVFRIEKSQRPKGRWSLDSPKSLSSFILLSPWIDEDKLIEAFGRKFMDEASLVDLFYQIMEIKGDQPLDCVGTAGELKLSLNLAIQQNKFLNCTLTKIALESGIISNQNWQIELSNQLDLQSEHAMPADLYAKILPLIKDVYAPLEFLEDKDIVFVGKGKGRSLDGMEKFLRSKINFANFSVVDKDKDNEAKPLAFLKEFDPRRTAFIKNEGIPGREMPVAYLTPMQLFLSEAAKYGAKIIGITGTKGKSTTSALTYHILKSAGKDVILAGNIGKSAIACLTEVEINPATVFVLELSSYQLSDIQPKLDVAACLNLFNDHADWHGSSDQYWSDKQNIVRALPQSSYFVYNPSFAKLLEWSKQTKAIPQPIDTTEQFDMSQANLFGEHNRLNVLVAKKIASLMGVDEQTAGSAINSFQPLEHRMQYVDTKNSLTFIDDAIGMTPESTIASIEAVRQKYGSIGCLLLGGQDRHYNFDELMNKLYQLNVPNIILFPNTVQKMKDALPAGYKPNLFEADNMSDAVTIASQQAPHDSVVLLSTAAPSYSLWKDFEDKGNQFQDAVKQLA